MPCAFCSAPTPRRAFRLTGFPDGPRATLCSPPCLLFFAIDLLDPESIDRAIAQQFPALYERLDAIKRHLHD